MRPESKIVTIFEVMDLCDQLIARASGWLSGGHWFGLPRLMDRTVPRSSGGRFRRARSDRNVGRRRGLNQQVGSIEIVLPGNTDKGEKRIATCIRERRSHPL